jgi:micrococcal nuclease
MIRYHSHETIRPPIKIIPMLVMAVLAALLISACNSGLLPTASGSNSSFVPTQTRVPTKAPNKPATKTSTKTGGLVTPTKTRPPIKTATKTPTQTSSNSSGSSNGGGVNVNYPKMPAGLQTGRVVKVVDGDTIDVSINGQTERVRMIGINTPESVDPRRVIQCFGVEASSRAKKLLSNQTVGLEMDPTQGDTDQYGRLLRYVWFSDGRMFNLQMLAEGFANEFTFNIPYKYQKLFKTTARAADFAGVGLWSTNTCNGDFNSPTKTP